MKHAATNVGDQMIRTSEMTQLQKLQAVRTLAKLLLFHICFKYVQKIADCSECMSLADSLCQSRVCVGEQLLKVGLEPSTGLRSGLKSVRETAVKVVAARRGVGSSVALATGLDPDKGINEIVTSAGGRPDTETSADGVAPITPSCLSSWLLAAAAGISDEMNICPTIVLEKWGNGVDVELLIVVGVTGGVRWGRADGESVVVGNVGSKTTDLRWATSITPDLVEELCSGVKVGSPAQPASVSDRTC